MNILILGGGGREHSLAWAVKQNPKCDRLIVAPGNAGIAAIAECADLDILDPGLVVTFAEENAVDFVIVGPEAPVGAGVADRLREAGIATFGLSQLYLSVGDKSEDGKLVVRIWYKPWILCVWGGALIMALGGLISLSDRRLRVGAPAKRAGVAPVAGSALGAAE